MFKEFDREKFDSPPGKFRYDFWRWCLITFFWTNVIFLVSTGFILLYRGDSGASSCGQEELIC